MTGKINFGRLRTGNISENETYYHYAGFVEGMVYTSVESFAYCSTGMCKMFKLVIPFTIHHSLTQAVLGIRQVSSN